MTTLHVQYIAIANKGETKEGLQHIAKRIKARLKCKVGEPRAVEIPSQGAGWVLDVLIDMGVMSVKECHQEASKIASIYQYKIE
jgi:hypothetical protein